jgi:L-ascorbate metabolism protein UlaG (beta-lactamase superfamily)
MIPARLKDEELIKEVESFDNDEKHFHFWWLGQSGYLLTWKGNRVLLDPYLSDSLTAKYASTDKPHLRMSERVVDPNLLTNISAVTSSHNHTDHLDAETLIPIIKTNPEISMIIPEANRNFVCDRLHCSIDFPTGLDDGLSTTIGPFKFTGIPASHNEIEKDEEGRCKFLGYILQFGEWSIYHSGDTLLYEGIEAKLRNFNINVAMLPINGNDPARRVAGNLDFKEAANLGKAIGAYVVVPCHYDMFEFNTADPKKFAGYAESIGQRYLLLEPGGHFSSEFL